MRSTSMGLNHDMRVKQLAAEKVVKLARRCPLVDRSSARESNSDSLAAVATIAAVPASELGTSVMLLSLRSAQ